MGGDPRSFCGGPWFCGCRPTRSRRDPSPHRLGGSRASASAQAAAPRIAQFGDCMHLAPARATERFGRACRPGQQGSGAVCPILQNGLRPHASFASFGPSSALATPGHTRCTSKSRGWCSGIPHTYGASRMAEQHESEGRRSRGWGAPGALESPSHRDPSFGFADLDLLGRLAEEMYGELAFARAASAHPRSTVARGDTRTSPPSSDSGSTSKRPRTS